MWTRAKQVYDELFRWEKYEAQLESRSLFCVMAIALTLPRLLAREPETRVTNNTVREDV